jgi:hypothetical protein
VDDMLVFPWSEIMDAVIALWVADLEARRTYAPRVDQEKVARRRGVPDVVRRRRA